MRALASTSKLRSWQQRSVQIALCALLLRALVPSGYMAAPLADGWPWQLCPSGMASASFAVLLGDRVDNSNHDLSELPSAGHAHHAEHSGAHPHASDEPDPACGLGAGFAALAQAPFAAPATPEMVSVVLDLKIQLAQPRAPPRRYNPRAPPREFLPIA